MGSVSWNYGTQRFEYGNGQAASSNDLSNLFNSLAANGDLTSYSGSSLGYDHLYAMNISGDVRLVG